MSESYPIGKTVSGAPWVMVERKSITDAQIAELIWRMNAPAPAELWAMVPGAPAFEDWTFERAEMDAVLAGVTEHAQFVLAHRERYSLERVAAAEHVVGASVPARRVPNPSYVVGGLGWVSPAAGLRMEVKR